MVSGDALDTTKASRIQVIRNWLYKISLGAMEILLVAAAVGYISAWAVSLRRDIALLLLLLLPIVLLSFSHYVKQLRNIPFFIGVTSFLVITRVVWFLNIHTVPVSDFAAYYQLACEVAGGNGLTNPAIHLLNGWGYPWLLGLWFWIFGCSVQNGEILNLILIIAALPLLYLLADAIGGKVAARWSVIFYVLWPAQLIFSSVLATEHLALVLLLAGFLFGVRLFNKQGNQWVNILFCGVLLTLGSIVRPAVLVILGSLVLTFLLYSKERKALLVAAVGVILTYFLLNSLYNKALMIFNDGVVPSFAFSTAMNLYYGLNYDSTGEWSAEDNAVIFAWPEDQILQQGIRDSLTRLSTYSPRQIVTLFYRKNQEFWATPNYAYYWSTDTLEPENDSLMRSMDKFVFIPNLFQIGVIILVFFGGFILLLHPDFANLESVFLALLLATGMHLIFAVDSRYSHIFVPLLFIVGGVGLSMFNDSGKESLEENINTNSLADFSNQRKRYWNHMAPKLKQFQPWNQYYHRRMYEIYQNLVPSGSRVLELGCGYGDLLAAVKPSHGVGVDFSPAMLEIARQRHPDITFVEADAHEFDSSETFDVIILSDLVDDLWDVECVFDKIKHYSAPTTRVIINYYSRIWGPLIAFTEHQGLSVPRLQQNWLVQPDVENLLYLAGFNVVRHQREILWPFIFRPLEIFCNRFLVKLWPFNWFALVNFTLACPIPDERSNKPAPSVSIIIPARNEAGNIGNIFQSVPSMGSSTELIFIEGHSTDNTYDTIEKALKANDRPAKLFRQTGKGKGDAVRLGFSKANGDILMILDADLTVRPEDLVRFYQALSTGRGDFINGVRLVYPMDKEAMRFFNFIGNRFFSLAFSWLLDQNVKDTLCGTKVLWKRDYERIACNRSYFGDFDPFGDFDLLFGAARLNMRIIDLPIRYRERTYGTTNIQRWRHGWLLLRMVIFAAFRIKFV